MKVTGSGWRGCTSFQSAMRQQTRRPGAQRTEEKEDKKQHKKKKWRGGWRSSYTARRSRTRKLRMCLHMVQRQCSALAWDVRVRVNTRNRDVRWQSRAFVSLLHATATRCPGGTGADAAKSNPREDTPGACDTGFAVAGGFRSVCQHPGSVHCIAGVEIMQLTWAL
eukprot:3119339-Rhodomonas_salina.3